VPGPTLQEMDKQILPDGAHYECRELFDYTFITRLVDEHRRGTRDWSFHLWALLNVSLWHDRWFK
jgi:hypothetical protein